MEVGDGRLQGYTFAAALLWAVLLLILAPGSKGEPAAQPRVDNDPEGAPYVAGELLVAYEPGTSEEAEETVVRQSGARTLEDLPGEVRLVSFPAIRREASGAARERALARALRYLAHKAGVVAVDYNYLREPFFMPNDPRLANQWGLTSTRFGGAWNDAKGDGAKVAIVDSGVYSEHPDIGRIIAQRDFVEGDAVADDDYGHGTHVTGIAGALTDNGKGVAGGCFECGLIIAKVMGAGGFTTDSRIVKGINWSMNQGADVVNLSLGGPADSSVLRTAVNRAYGQGAVVVAAAGNEGINEPRYPAAYSNVIAVGATSTDGKLARFSTRGDGWIWPRRGRIYSPPASREATTGRAGPACRRPSCQASPGCSPPRACLRTRSVSACNPPPRTSVPRGMIPASDTAGSTPTTP